MYEFVIAGGWLMVPILACSVAVIAIAIERYWALRPARVVPPALLHQVWSWLKRLPGKKSRNCAIRRPWARSSPPASATRATVGIS